jgi:hypothetical protein
MQKTTNYKQQTTNNKRKTTNNKQQNTNDKRQTNESANQQPTICDLSTKFEIFLFKMRHFKGMWIETPKKTSNQKVIEQFCREKFSLQNCSIIFFFTKRHYQGAKLPG